jgi:hypothetical protein
MRIYIRFLLLVVIAASVLVPTEAGATPQRRTETVSRDCYAAADVWWPASSRAWVKSVIKRESGGRAYARNPRSTARGCLQLLHSLHAHRYNKVGFGCNASKWSNPDCGILAGLHLFRQAGKRPWAVTRYTR